MVGEGSEAVLDPLALALLSIFGGATVTVIAGLIGAGIQGRREHRKWIRERRFEAYSQAYELLEQVRYFQEDEDADYSAEGKQYPDQLTPEQREKFREHLKEAREAHSPGGFLRRWIEIRELKVATSALLMLIGPPPVNLAVDKAADALLDKDKDAYDQALTNLSIEMRKALGVKS
jgi:hypothetical protein